MLLDIIDLFYGMIMKNFKKYQQSIFLKICFYKILELIKNISVITYKFIKEDEKMTGTYYDCIVKERL